MARLHTTNNEGPTIPEVFTTGLPRRPLCDGSQNTTSKTSRSPRKLLLDRDQSQARQQRSLKLVHVDSLLLPNLGGSLQRVLDPSTSADDGGCLKSARAAKSKIGEVVIGEEDEENFGRQKYPLRAKHVGLFDEYDEDDIWNRPRVPRTTQPIAHLEASPRRGLWKDPIEVVDLTNPMKQPSKVTATSMARKCGRSREQRNSLSSSSGLDDAAMIKL